MKHLVLVMIVGVLVGCGKEDSVQPNMPNPKASQPTTPNSYTANTKPKAAKAKVIVGGKLWEFETGGRVTTDSAIGADGTVYVGSGDGDGKLYAINGKTGVKLWEFETRYGVYSSPAIGSDGTVYVGSDGGKLYAINGKTGAKLWDFETIFLCPPPPPSDLMARFTSGHITKSSMPSMARLGSSNGNLKRGAGWTPPPPSALMARCTLG